jgi:hypothetical protein
MGAEKRTRFTYGFGFSGRDFEAGSAAQKLQRAQKRALKGALESPVHAVFTLVVVKG